MPVREFRNDVAIRPDAGPQCPASQPKISFQASSAGIDRGNERRISDLARPGVRCSRRSKIQSPQNGLASAYEAIEVLHSVISL